MRALTRQEIHDLSHKEQSWPQIEALLGISFCAKCFHRFNTDLIWLNADNGYGSQFSGGIIGELGYLLNHCGSKLDPVVHESIENYLSVEILQRKL